MLRHAVLSEQGPVALRYPRGSEGIYREDHSNEAVSILREGTDVTIVFHGSMANPVLSAVEKLESHGVSAEVIKLNRILPLETEKVLSSLQKTHRLVCAEDACRAGSAGNMILSAVASGGIVLRSVKRIDLGNGVIPHGKPQELYHMLGMDAEGIAAAVMEAVNEKDPA